MVEKTTEKIFSPYILFVCLFLSLTFMPSVKKVGDCTSTDHYSWADWLTCLPKQLISLNYLLFLSNPMWKTSWNWNLWWCKTKPLISLPLPPPSVSVSVSVSLSLCLCLSLSLSLCLCLSLPPSLPLCFPASLPTLLLKHAFLQRRTAKSWLSIIEEHTFDPRVLCLSFCNPNGAFCLCFKASPNAKSSIQNPYSPLSCLAPSLFAQMSDPVGRPGANRQFEAWMFLLTVKMLYSQCCIRHEEVWSRRVDRKWCSLKTVFGYGAFRSIVDGVIVRPLLSKLFQLRCWNFTGHHTWTDLGLFLLLTGREKLRLRCPLP